MIEKANLHQLPSFVTADGSAIRELAGPSWTPARAQSLAEATVEPGAATAEHYHPQSEELYYFVAGDGPDAPRRPTSLRSSPATAS